MDGSWPEVCWGGGVGDKDFGLGLGVGFRPGVGGCHMESYGSAHV